MKPRFKNRLKKYSHLILNFINDKNGIDVMDVGVGSIMTLIRECVVILIG